MIARLLGGLGIRLECEVIDRRTVDLEVDGVPVAAPALTAQVVTAALAKRDAKLARMTEVTSTALEAARAAEAAALERADAAEAKVAELEREVAAARALLATAAEAAVRADAERRGQVAVLAAMRPLGRA